MTREQLYEIFEDVEQHRIYCKEQFADRIAALPLDLPEVDEVAKQANKEYPYHDVNNWNDTTIQRHAWNKCAVWMRSEILKRNTL